MINISLPFISIETPKTLLLFEVKDYRDDATPFNKGKRYVSIRYYGPKKPLNSFEPIEPPAGHGGSNNDYIVDCLLMSTVGNGNNEEPSLIIDDGSSSYTNRFFFEEAYVVDGGIDVKYAHARNVEKTLVIVEKDEVSSLELRHYFSIFSDSDVIASKKELINNSDHEITVDRIFSLELPIPAKKVSVYSFDGAWLYERNRHENVVEAGVFCIDSKSGSSSHKHNPFVEIIDEANGLNYGMNIIYAGNHKEVVEVHHLGHTKLMCGISDYLFHHKIPSKSSFLTPEAIIVEASSLDEITSSMQGFALNHIVNPKWAYTPRPVLFNNWEGTGMNINEKSLLEMAVIAKRVGIEMFVMDDGWFKNRIDGGHALGDWVVDTNKFPNGLLPFVTKIKDMGLKFGIWVEPEMISIDSDLYRAHPEYACRIPGRDPIERRHQLMIDMTNPEVVDYLFDALTKVFDEIRPDYVKWDYNRFMSDNYSSYGTLKGEFMHKYIQGTYELMERLSKRYPDMLMESCASGGGRCDLGMLYYMPQTWGSDDTNSYFRTFMCCGTLTGYPQSGYGAHISRDHSPSESGASASLEDRFNIHSIGAFGYEFDFRTFPDNELDIMAKQIAFYKEHRMTLQYGDYFVVDNVFDDERYYGYTVVNKDGHEAIMVAVQTKKDAPSKLWRAKGLDEKAVYEVNVRKQYNLDDSKPVEMTGRELMEKGLDLGDLSSTKDRDTFNGIFSRMVILRKK